MYRYMYQTPLGEGPGPKARRRAGDGWPSRVGVTTHHLVGSSYGILNPGITVRDLESDLYLSLSGESAVLIADGGNRPSSAGVSCNAADTAIHELGLDDAAGPVVDVFDTLVEAADLPAGALAGSQPITGISVDPGAGYLFVNIPVTPERCTTWTVSCGSTWPTSRRG